MEGFRVLGLGFMGLGVSGFRILGLGFRVLAENQRLL